MFKVKKDIDGFYNIDGKLPKELHVRKKPIIITAYQIDEAFEVETMEGIMSGKANDYLMIGVKGEMYPCDKKIFEETYDIIED